MNLIKDSLIKRLHWLEGPKSFEIHKWVPNRALRWAQVKAHGGPKGWPCEGPREGPLRAQRRAQ